MHVLGSYWNAMASHFYKIWKWSLNDLMCHQWIITKTVGRLSYISSQLRIGQQLKLHEPTLWAYSSSVINSAFITYLGKDWCIVTTCAYAELTLLYTVWILLVCGCMLWHGIPGLHGQPGRCKGGYGLFCSMYAYMNSYGDMLLNAAGSKVEWS